MLVVTIGGFVKDGKTIEKPISWKQNIWVTLWFALVLGAGGFWNLR